MSGSSSLIESITLYSQKEEHMLIRKKGYKMLSYLMIATLLLQTFSLASPRTVDADDLDPVPFVQAASELEIRGGQVFGEYPLHMTHVGNLDWLHLKGDAAGKIQEIRKLGSSSVTYSVYGETSTEGKENRGSDTDYMSYTWTDGVVENPIQDVTNGLNDSGFGVFYPKASRNAGIYDNVGWNIQVVPQTSDSTLVLGIGMWQADVDLKVYMNDDSAPAVTKSVYADGVSKIYQYQVKVPANVKLKVEGRLSKVRSKNGNMSLSGVALSSVALANKVLLQNEYNQVFNMTQGIYTDETWQSLVQSRDAAKRVLEQVDATQQQVDDTLQALIVAQNTLLKKNSNIVIDFTGNELKGYTFGSSSSTGNQKERYQTFTAPDNFTMKYVQVNAKRYKEPVSDMIVQLYTVETDVPATWLTETKVSSDSIVDGGLTTAEMNYNLEQGKRYAIVLTQENLQSGGYYYWTTMPSTVETKKEFFGKSDKGKFLPEFNIGTGMLRIVKESNVDSTSLQNKIDEIKQYNRQLYTLQSWSALESALNTAGESMADVDVTAEMLQAAADQIDAAFNGLVLAKNLDIVAAQIDAISQAVLKGYTSESAQALQQAIAEAKAVKNESEQDRAKAYSKVFNAMDALQLELKYQYEVNPKMTAGFGFEGDKNTSLSFLDGSYQIGGTRPMQHGPIAPKQMVTFGATSNANIKWYNAEGYLPVFVHEFTNNDMNYKIETFGNKKSVEGNDYVINYSRVTVTNKSSETRLLPVVSSNLVLINQVADEVFTIKSGETVVKVYAIEGDKYEYFDAGKTKFTSLTRDQISKLGTFDSNYGEMKTYWNNRLSTVVDLDLPNKELVNAFKAGYIYEMIIKDAQYLHVGENGYARLYSHDTLGIVVQLIQNGDFEHAKDYLKSIPLTGGINIETGQVDPNLFWDANWKLPWAYAVYLSKTGDTSIFDETMTADDGSQGTIFDKRVKFGAKSIQSDRVGDGGIMKQTKAIDTLGYWTIDNYSALTGLTSYEYIARELYKAKGEQKYLDEAAWAKDQYDKLLTDFTSKLQQTITDKGLNYIPASVVQSNDENRMKDPRDANWASMYLFGRWLWDGYLYGANQPEDNINLTMLDKTYAYGIERRAGVTDSAYNFGGYPHGFYSSSYNAGYGSAALRGEEYRDMGIKAYEFMIKNSMSGPFSWWEGVYDPDATPWATLNDNYGFHNTPGGGGSAQHMWGQAVASKVLVDSLIAERIYDQNTKYEIIVGRGIPKEWVKDANKNNNVVAKVQNYPAFQGGRVGYSVVRQANNLVFTFNTSLDQAKADTSDAEFSIQLPSMVNNIKKTSAGVVDNAKGIVTVPLGTKSVTITLRDLPEGSDNGNGNGNSGSNGSDNGNNNNNNGNNGNSGNNGNNNNNGNNGNSGNRPKFSDITNHWALKSIMNAVEHEIVKGYEDGTFRPNNVVKRSELMVMIGRALKLPQEDVALSFEDASSIPAWAKSYIANAAKSGIVKGYEDNTFRPDGKVTRIEFVAMVTRALDLQGSTKTLPFADADQIPAWGKDYAIAAYEAGLIQGKGNNKFAPNDPLTRGEAVTVLMKLVK